MTENQNEKEQEEIVDEVVDAAVEVEIIEESDSSTGDEAGDVDDGMGQPAADELIGDLEILQRDLASARAEAAEYLDGWQRARAEFANYKKRVEREQSEARQRVVGDVIRRYLGVADDLERALKNRPQDGEGAAWSNGIDLIYSKLLTTLENDGVTSMDAVGQMFDPNLHEAITSEDSETHESGEIIEVIQNGYLIGDRVLRPAMVRVAR